MISSYFQLNSILWIIIDLKVISLQKPATTVRLFERTDYYSVHGEDAHLAAKIIFKSTATVKTMAPGEVEEIDYISLSKGNFEILLRELLLVKNYRVEVFCTRSGTNDWAIEYKGSPGNLIQFENLLYNNTEMVVSSSLIAVNMKQCGQQKVDARTILSIVYTEN